MQALVHKMWPWPNNFFPFLPNFARVQPIILDAIVEDANLLTHKRCVVVASLAHLPAVCFPITAV
jgi:hypothetical protein